MSKTVSRNRKNTWLNAGGINTANNRPVLGRLLGLETEYSLHLESANEQPMPADWYSLLVAQLAQHGPLVPSRRDDQTYFIANGGNISFETRNGAAVGSGYLEGATPECTSPMTLMAYQIVQDQTLAEQTQLVFGERKAKLLKNSCDDVGHLYGQQENYEVDVATGWRLAVWRMGLFCLLPLVLVYKATSRVWLGLVCLLSIIGRSIAWMRYHAAIRWAEMNGRLELARLIVPPHLLVEEWSAMSPRMMHVAVRGMRLLHMPLAFALSILIYCFALVPYRKHLLPFLASRAIFDGAGHLDEKGRFHLSARALHTTCTIGFGHYWGERPVLATGSWLQGICTDPWYSLESWHKLFCRRQRVQISLGDSTTNHASEYLRVGVTALVLDLIESGRCSELPQLAKPLMAIRGFASDWMLLHRTMDRRSATWNAIEIQRSYLHAVRKLLQNHWQVPAEAWQILQQWQTVLDQLQASKLEGEAKQWMLGRVDWFSKKWLIDQIPTSAPTHAKKKIDLRYHELSSEGYQQKMLQALGLPDMVSDEQVSRAKRLPPSGTPAAQRAYLIREFAMGDHSLRVDWDGAEYGTGSERRVVRFRKPR